MADKSMTYEWLPIPGYVGRYAVSNRGEVMSMNYRNTGLPGIMSPQDNTKGYLKVMLTVDGKWKSRSVHSLVAEAFIGPRPLGMDINHKNGVKKDNRPENLEYCSTAQNCQHAHDIGLGNPCRGEAHRSAVLTEIKVMEIRRLHNLGLSNQSIAKTFGIPRQMVWRVVSGSTWRHVKPVEA